MQNQKRFAAFFLMHIDVTPAHGFSNASTECFRHRFFCREPRREMARRKFHRLAIDNFALGENPVHKTFTKAIERMLNPLDLNQIDANAEHAHGVFVKPLKSLNGRNFVRREATIPLRFNIVTFLTNHLTPCNSPSAPASRERRSPSPQKLRATR